LGSGIRLPWAARKRPVEGGERNSGLPLRQEPQEVGSGSVSPHGNAEAAEAAVNSERGEPAKKPGM